jgi:hypothetical protein
MLDKKGVAQAVKVVRKAMSKDSAQASARLTQVVDGERRFSNDLPLVVPIGELLPPEQALRFDEAIHDVIDGYRRTLSADRRHLLTGYKYVDLARKVVGVGSVGTRAWIVLMMGRDDRDVLLLREGGASLGPGSLRGREPVRIRRAAGGGGAAPDAGQQRHLPRVASRDRYRRAAT